MEWNMFSALSEWAPEGKSDFTFGAKPSSCLPSAYSQDVLASAGLDLLSPCDQSDLVAFGDHVELFDGASLSTEAFEDDMVQPSNFFNAHMDSDDADLLRTMKTEDMMIPLSELIAEEIPLPKSVNNCKSNALIFINPITTSSPPKIETVIAASPPPPPPQKRKKIIITARSVKKTCITPSIKVEMPSPQPSYIQPNFVQPIDNQLTQLSETDVLLDELVRMVEKEDGECDFLNIDSTLVEENMNDLLAHLEDTSKQQIDLPKIQIPKQNTFYLTVGPTPLPQPSPSHSEDSYIPSDIESANSPYSTVDTSMIDSSVNSPASVIDPYVSSSEETQDDPEYIADVCHSYTRQRGPRGRRANASKPYPEGRKERKKEQNKQAALRYRQKKKQEEDDFQGRIRAEEERKKELTKEYNNIKQELSCMKKIMREVFIAKGLISADAFNRIK